MVGGKYQACKVLLKTHDAFHFYIGSRFGWQLVIYMEMTHEMHHGLAERLAHPLNTATPGWIVYSQHCAQLIGCT